MPIHLKPKNLRNSNRPPMLDLEAHITSDPNDEGFKRTANELVTATQAGNFGTMYTLNPLVLLGEKEYAELVSKASAPSIQIETVKPTAPLQPIDVPNAKDAWI